MQMYVAILEKELELRDRMRDVLVRMGHAVVREEHEALGMTEFLRDEWCDLLLTEVQVDGRMDGIEVAKIAKERGSDVIFVTDRSDLAALQKVAEIEFVGFLLKPFREDEFEALVHLAEIRRSGDEVHGGDTVRFDETYLYCYTCAKLFAGGKPVNLTEHEHRFLLALLQTNESLLTYERLDIAIWGEFPIDANRRRQLVHRFRRKVPYFPLELVKGKGYRLTFSTPI